MKEYEELDKIWDYLVERGIATNAELNLISKINGYTIEMLESVIYARTGYNSFEQLKGETDEN